MPKKHKKNQVSRSRRPFNIIVKPAGPSCNIACEYCYYLEKEKLYKHKTQKDFIIKQDVLENFIKQYITSQPAGVNEINFLWQGGEPLLTGLNFYKTAVKLQKKYCPPGMHISNNVQTNGTLLDDEKARFFAENNFLLGISIDGPEQLHNKFRKNIDGTGTFTKVMKGIEVLKKHNVDFNTLTVVQSSNAEYPAEVYSFLKSIGSTFMQFIPIVEPTVPISTRSVSPVKWGKFMNEVFNIWLKQDIGKIFVGHFDMLLGIYAGYPASLCVHAKTCGSALAMEHNGDIYSCDHFVFPENLLGNITTSKLSALVDGSKQTKFGLDKFEQLSDKCLHCGFLELCFGGCPKNRLIETDSGRLNWLCEGYKMFYEHTLPYFQAMARALENHRPADEFRKFL